MVPGSAPPAWPQHGALQFEDVKMRYRPGLPLVLKGLTFAVPAGTSCGVVGRTGAGRGRARERESERGVKRGAELGTLTCAHARRRAAGAGKSSILNALFRLVELDSGRVLLDGVNTCEGRGGRGGGVRARAGLRFEAASLNSPPPPAGCPAPQPRWGCLSCARRWPSSPRPPCSSPARSGERRCALGRRCAKLAPSSARPPPCVCTPHACITCPRHPSPPPPHSTHPPSLQLQPGSLPATPRRRPLGCAAPRAPGPRGAGQPPGAGHGAVRGWRPPEVRLGGRAALALWGGGCCMRGKRYAEPPV